jgi:hypothetical protein
MMAMPPGTKGRYLANEEPFRIRRKGFWPLDQSRKVHVRILSHTVRRSCGPVHVDGRLSSAATCLGQRMTEAPTAHSL